MDAHQVELFTEQEKQYIKTEFTYGKTSRFARNSVLAGLNGDPTDQIANATEPDDFLSKDMFTDHLLDSVANNLLKNCETKSIILAPFNSTRSNLQEKLDNNEGKLELS